MRIKIEIIYRSDMQISSREIRAKELSPPSYMKRTDGLRFLRFDRQRLANEQDLLPNFIDPHEIIVY